ncbi:MAG TPA: ACP S-malonyltransferase [Thermodesulfobacteriota bacterium]|nr:ACP S-malonyltransferase [Deltaproteobacteria bacterium]HNR12633.1 ACP S-malonyltransferase [Thermodesulfobacteriota bacterium]HNU71166.1 ACP S-malonyltransferase [Thermodesulfobacteriota bacterium]HOC38416.1 ACP S-malonyltransferase [Thermodesulfobacteriota bacterium]HQO77111.1 ACP S-malonyltransferase [Thermodesulfobacteriota bacterium]
MKSFAFLFPGQGAQSVGMGKDLSDAFSEAKEVFAEADDALGFKLSSLCFQGPESDLILTMNTQPAIVTVSIAALRVLESRLDITPQCAAGHSLGEYSALIASQALTFRDGVQAVRKRGQFMQEAVPAGEGGMAAILGMEREQVEELCRKAAGGEILTPANFNAPGQIVISGHIGAVDRAIGMAKSMGALKTVRLAVSAPFHCQLMGPAGSRLADHLSTVTIHPLMYPVVTNVEARENSDAGRVKEILVRQLSSPVLWEDSIRSMVASGVEMFIEIGPGKVLSGLVKRISKSATILNLEDSKSLASLEKTWKEMH